MTERFFMDVALIRVLYARSLLTAPQLALGRFAPVSRLLADPALASRRPVPVPAQHPAVPVSARRIRCGRHPRRRRTTWDAWSTTA